MYLRRFAYGFGRRILSFNRLMVRRELYLDKKFFKRSYYFNENEIDDGFKEEFEELD